MTQSSNRTGPDSDAAEVTGPTSVRRAGIDIAGHTRPLLSLTCDYHTTPRPYWSEVLGNIHALGFRMVDVRVIWECHALPDGSFDFGASDPQLDVVEFLRLAARHQLLVCVRPGPRQEPAPSLRHGGIAGGALPDPVSAADASDSEDTIGSNTEPMLASEVYLSKAEVWLETVGELLRPLCYPRGPIVALHLDSASSFTSYEAGLWDQHLDAHAAFRHFVKGRYERPSSLRRAYGDPALDFSTVAPPQESAPRDPSGLTLHQDWSRFQLLLITRAFERFQAALQRSCPALPVSVPELAARSRLQLRFLDVGPRGLPSTRRWTSSGGATLLDNWGGRLPLVDVSIGRDSTVGHQANQALYRTLLCLAAGARGFCLSPGCESPGLAGGLVTVNGEPTGLATLFAPLLAALERTQFHTLRLEPCVHIVVSEYLLELGHVTHVFQERPQGWLTQSSILEAPALDGLLAHPEVRMLGQVRETLHRLEASLLRHGVPFRYASEWELDTVITTAPWTVLPTTEATPAELIETIDYAERRGAAFSIGPFVPSALQLHRPASELPLALSLNADALEQQVSDLVQGGQLPRRDNAGSAVRTLFHVRPAEPNEPATLAVAFVLNPTQHAVNVEVACPGYAARDALSLEPIASFAERFQLSVPKEGVRMLELFPNDRS